MHRFSPQEGDRDLLSSCLSEGNPGTVINNIRCNGKLGSVDKHKFIVPNLYLNVPECKHHFQSDQGFSQGNPLLTEA